MTTSTSTTSSPSPSPQSSGGGPSSSGSSAAQHRSLVRRHHSLTHVGRSTLYLALTTVGAVTTAALAPPLLSLPILCIPMCVLPGWYAARHRTAYLRQRKAIDNIFPGESLVRMDGHMIARKQQAEAVMQDPTPFLLLGTAMGFTTMNLDGYGPDAGMPFGLTIADLAQHLLVVGTSGTGKTSGVLRPLLWQYVQAKAGGLLVLDGKGSLAAEMRGLPNFTVIDPSVDLGLIEGLEPADVVRAMASVGAHFGSTHASASGGFFISEGSTMLFHACVLKKAMVKAGIADHHWTLYDIYKMLVDLNADPKGQGEKISETLASYRPESEGDSILLVDALTYAVATIVSMNAETRSNVWATVQSWMSPIFQHPDLVKWSHTEHGIDITKIDQGAGFGVSLPEVKYNKAGLLAQSLIKERVFNILRARADVGAAGKCQIAIVVDEAQELIGEADKAFLPVARGLGGIAVYASQSIDAFYARIGNRDEASAFLDTFSSQLMLRSSKHSIEWMQERLGMTIRPQWKGNGSAIGFTESLKSLARSDLGGGDEGGSIFRSLRRHGAGQFALPTGAELTLGRDFGSEADLAVVASTVVEFKPGPLVTMDEANSHLLTKFVALAQVQRGGVPRRDFIQLKPMYKFPNPSPAEPA